MVPDEQAPRLTDEQARHLHCYICGNDDAYELRDLDEPITVGPNTALVRIRAAVCRYCGEHVFDLPTRARLERVRDHLARGDVSDFEPVGLTYRVP
jgi:YgiT-type zinc finger domain-containing protein